MMRMKRDEEKDEEAEISRYWYQVFPDLYQIHTFEGRGIKKYSGAASGPCQQ